MEDDSTGSERPVVVLLVEDSRTDAELMASMLGRSGAARFDVTVVGTLADGLAWLTRRSPDIVLLDLTLPDSERLATYRAVRNRKPDVPVVVVTGLVGTPGQIIDRLRAYERAGVGLMLLQFSPPHEEMARFGRDVISRFPRG